MQLTYTSAFILRTRVMQRPVSGARLVSGRGWLTMGSVGLVLLACATGGSSGLPRGGSRLASGSTPEPARYEVVVGGSRAQVWERVDRVLSDSLFHVSAPDSSTLFAYNLARMVKIRAEMVRRGKDSTRVSLTGETYLGDTTRRDSISGLPEQWRLITPADPGSVLLRGIARALHQSHADASAAHGAGSSLRLALDSSPGSSDYSLTAASLAATPVGRALEVCRSPAVPPGWLILYWYADPTRCQGLADERYPGEPNVMRIEREW